MAARPRDPGRRVLLAAAAVLRDRRQLPVRDPRRNSAQWLQTNWPDALLLGQHRARLASQLVEDAELRHEVRDRLALREDERYTVRPRPDDLPDTVERLALFVASADDPVAVVEHAAVHDDPGVAAAATPYLVLDAEVPPGPASPPSEPTRSSATVDHLAREQRRTIKRLRADAAELRRELREATGAATELAEQNAQLVAQLVSQRAQIDAMREQLPTKRQKAALAAAADLDARLRRLGRELEQERSRRAAAAHQADRELADAKRELAAMKTELDKERSARRRLANELGNAADRARRLRPLLEREAEALRGDAAPMRPGPDRSRTTNRADRLASVAHELAELYQLEYGTEGSGDGSGGQEPTPEPTPARTVPLRLRVTPLGGACHIGGSALLIEAGGTRLLVDAGVRPDQHVSRPGPERIADALRDRLDAIVITHAHADHAGFVPWVVEHSRRTPVLCSPETRALLPEVWNDSVRVMRAQAETASSWSGHVAPPYGDAEVSQAEELLRDLPYGNHQRIGNLEITLFKAGHILGAAGVVVQAGDRRVVITGDIDDRGQASVGPAEIPPRLTAGADLLVIETTYCNRQHEERSVESQALARRAEEVLACGGRILVPAFGLGRAQEIALLMREQLPDVDVLVDGLARNISELYALNGAPTVLGGRVRKVENRKRAIAGFSSGVIITTSGMLTGGAAIPWADAILREPESALFLCGHQDEDSPGRELEELAASDPEQPRQVHLRDDEGRVVTVPVTASIHRYNLSAHADSAGLTRIVQQIAPQAVMLVHGQPAPQAEFRARLNALGYLVVDNRQAWDPAASAPDSRFARRRHGGGTSRGRQR